jgi:hypothetical protein
MTSDDAPDPAVTLQVAVDAAVAALAGMAPVERAAAAHRAARTVTVYGQQALAAAYADALAALVAQQGTQPAAAAALAEYGERTGDAALAALDGEAVRQALHRARRRRSAPDPTG